MQIAVALPGLDPNPMVVMQLLRALGPPHKVREIAATLSANSALLQEEMPERPGPAQVERLRKLMQTIEVIAVRPRILIDGQETQPRAFIEILENAERMLANATSRPGASVA